MRILFIIDPLAKLDLKWDTSLGLAREFFRRGNAVWFCDTRDLFFEQDRVFSQVRSLIPVKRSRFKTGKMCRHPAAFFDLVMIRKEPPFDMNYIYLTYLMELASRDTVVSNCPTGIRNLNEKFSALKFLPVIPQSVVASRPGIILEFQKKLGEDLVIKPLDLKGGEGVFLVKKNHRRNHPLLWKRTRQGKNFVIAQEKVRTGRVPKDKRILLLGGKYLSAFERQARGNDFRTNLSLDGESGRTSLTLAERKLVRSLVPLLNREGIHLAGIDVMGGKLLEINVTCPAGITEVDRLYGGKKFIAQWADYLESLVATSQGRSKARRQGHNRSS
ncbi:MAG: hypothetical protein ACOY3K_02450 [Candidatus Omnitrophota bacterium]